MFFLLKAVLNLVMEGMFFDPLSCALIWALQKESYFFFNQCSSSKDMGEFK